MQPRKNSFPISNSPLFTKAYGKAPTLANAASGFQQTGLWPDIFPEHLFVPAATTDIPHYEPSRIPEASDVPMLTTSLCQTADKVQDENVEAMEVNVSPMQVAVADISPVPSISFGDGFQRKRKQKKSPTVLTSSSYIKELQQKHEVKREKVERTEKKKAKWNLSFGKQTLYEKDPFDFNDDDSEDCHCLYCTELYSQSKPEEQWVTCQQCKLWAHNECAGVSYKAKQFVCDVCK